MNEAKATGLGCPSVDVVIPTHNRLALLPAAIASVLAQTTPVQRIIVVDDGSTDGTRAWVRDFAARDRRVVLIEQQHGGANVARNAGIARSTAEWIAFLDSDDEWETNKLSRQFELLHARPDCIGLFTGFRLVGGSIERTFLPPSDPTLLDLRGSNVLSSTSSGVIRADMLRRVGCFDPGLPSCQDWDLWFRLRREGRLGVVREPLVRFNSGPHERITKSLDKVLDGHAAMFTRLCSGVSSRRELASIKARHRLVRADIHRRFGAHDAALALALRSFVDRPSRWALTLAWKAARSRWREGLRPVGRSIAT